MSIKDLVVSTVWVLEGSAYIEDCKDIGKGPKIRQKNKGHFSYCHRFSPLNPRVKSLDHPQL